MPLTPPRFLRHLALECRPLIDSVVLTIRHTLLIPDETRARLVK